MNTLTLFQLVNTLPENQIKWHRRQVTKEILFLQLSQSTQLSTHLLSASFGVAIGDRTRRKSNSSTHREPVPC